MYQPAMIANLPAFQILIDTPHVNQPGQYRQAINIYNQLRRLDPTSFTPEEQAYLKYPPPRDCSRRLLNRLRTMYAKTIKPAMLVP